MGKKIVGYFFFKQIFTIFFLFLFFVPEVCALEKVEITTLDTAVTGYASFGSFNQKIAQNKGGIFLTYRKTNNAGNTVWKLLRSTDGGKSFTTVFTGTHDTAAPLVEAASNGDVYVATGGNPVYLYKLTSQDNYNKPTLLGTILPNENVGKMSMILDEKRQRLYYFSHYAYFSILDLNGKLIKGYRLGGPQCGPSACYQRQMLTLDENGVLYGAWSTVREHPPADPTLAYVYWDIHFIISKDGGLTWQKLNGTKLIPPLIPDETGPTDRITLDNEFDVSTYLTTFLAKDKKIYFPYEAKFPSNIQHFMRYDISSIKKDLDITPIWGGETIRPQGHIFCATKLHESKFPIYCIGSANSKQIGVIVSYDQGKTWSDYALSDFSGDTNAYSVAGAREITSDGYLIGTYTNAVASTADNTSAVRFFRVKVSATGKKGDYDNNGKVDVYDYNTLLSIFGKSDTTHDLTGDKKIDLYDYNMFVSVFGK